MQERCKRFKNHVNDFFEATAEPANVKLTELKIVASKNTVTRVASCSCPAR